MASSVLVNNLAKDWLNHCEASGMTAMTMRGYRYTINKVLLPFCEARGLEDVGVLTQAVFDELNRELLAREYRGKPISKLAVDHYLRCIRTFCRWAQEETEIAFGSPKRIKVGAPAPKEVLSRKEIQALEDGCRSERDKLIIRVLGDTGMRVGELVSLTPEALVERNRHHYLLVHGKGDYFRLVPIPRLERRLRRLIERGRGEPCANRIFVSSRNINNVYGALTTSGVWQIVVAAAWNAKLAKKVHPHLFRHSLITHLRGRRWNDAQIATVVGNFTELAGYTHLTAVDAYGMMTELDN